MLDAPLAAESTAASIAASTAGLTAALIVRDEEADLPGCLASLSGFAGRVVVVDTGSSDRTVALAREAGATVITARWVDDFATARNLALAACTTPWVLSIDADERLVGEAEWLPVLLDAASPTTDALSVEIEQVGAFGAHAVRRHRAAKLFRPERCRWRGRVHERLLRRDGRAPSVLALPETVLRLVHHGYADPAVFAAKLARNERLAELEVADLLDGDAPADEVARALLDLGRTRIAGPDPERGRACLRQVRDRVPPPREPWLWASDLLAWDRLRSGDPDGAAAYADELERAGAPKAYLHWLRAQVAQARGEDKAPARLACPVTVTGRPR